MANSLTSLPMIIDTDIASYRTTSGERLQGIRVSKITLAVGPGGASSVGAVTITAPSDSSTLYPPMIVNGASAANTVLYVDNMATNAPAYLAGLRCNRCHRNRHPTLHLVDGLMAAKKSESKPVVVKVKVKVKVPASGNKKIVVKK